MWDDLVAVAVIGVVMLVPIITIMTRHQQKMAELYRGDRAAQPDGARLQQDNEALRTELAEVKALLYEQAIAIDNLGKRSSPDLSERLEDRTR